MLIGLVFVLSCWYLTTPQICLVTFGFDPSGRESLLVAFIIQYMLLKLLISNRIVLIKLLLSQQNRSRSPALPLSCEWLIDGWKNAPIYMLLYVFVFAEQTTSENRAQGNTFCKHKMKCKQKKKLFEHINILVGYYLFCPRVNAP